MKSKSSSQLSRRAVFAGVGTAGAVAAVSSALPLVKPQAPVAAAPAKPAPERGGGYTLSEHVQRYYKTTRI
ncbi:formate dehydrogenase [Ottowia sp. GY511]|uniref:Formate dehydrogenase n=1 Tax=Ottowia flava TaxID=2675430 RepID=A0ABW4KMP0_9BURK|nr:formate dehydrogenase [Ottowia sp. GY511]TXK26330.1 formate dehydrogenase [Ottowia sp. GY511]